MADSNEASTHDAPKSDRHLDAAIVRLVLQDQFPALELRSIARLGSGWEYDAYLIDDHLVVRFPRYADVARDLDSAEAVLELVGSSIGSSVTVPKIILRGRGSDLFPHRFFGHELIPGIDASDPRAPEASGLAFDLGEALSHIHSISADSAEAIGIGHQKWTCRTSFDGLLDLAERAPALSELVPEAHAWIQSSPSVPAEYGGPPRFIHDDFQLEHILVDEKSGRLTGVIDWGAAVGDPAQDFTFLLPNRGWSFTRAALESYRLPIDDDFLDRLDFLGRVRALGWLAHAVVRDASREMEESLPMIEHLFAHSGSEPSTIRDGIDTLDLGKW